MQQHQGLFISKINQKTPQDYTRKVADLQEIMLPFGILRDWLPQQYEK